jgi:uncharacterized protein YegJ (DUF2314 family)
MSGVLKRFLITAAFLALANPVESRAVQGAPSSAGAQADVRNVMSDDPAMEAAKRKGRATLPQFFDRLASPASDESGFTVKFNLLSDGDAEFIWADNIERKNGKVFATLSNDPIAQGFVMGQRVEIDPSKIVDWGYFKAGVMQGNYTTRALLDGMSEAEAAPYRRALGW